MGGDELRIFKSLLLIAGTIDWRDVTVYLAGAMSGLPDWGFPAFSSAARGLRRRGAVVFSPPEIAAAHGFDPAHPEALDSILPAIIDAEIAALLTCDAVLLLDGWEGSPGTAVEIELARAAGIPVAEIRELVELELYSAA